MGKMAVYIGETVAGQLINGNGYAVEAEGYDFIWLKTETKSILRVEPKDVKMYGFEETENVATPWTPHPSEMKGYEFGKPKPKMEIPDELIDQTIANTEIYRRMRAALNAPQRTQVGYGIQKYPEPLTADTWTILETLGHIKGELMDGLHYITMLEIKFEMMGEKDLPK